MNTIKLYELDSMLSEFECTVLDCIKWNGKYKIVLDKTAFFPEGGGQTADKGVIGDANVLDVQEIEGEIYHFTDKPLTVNQSYTATLEFEERFDKMQNHSGEHIVSGIVNKKFGYQNVGFHLSESVVTLDFDGPLSREDLEKIELLANRAVQQNVAITAYYPKSEELKGIAYRSKLDLTDNVRLVEIDGYDICACCAPHVKTTGQIGLIKLLQCEKHKDGVRIFMKCGMRAISDYQNKYKNIAEISAALCAKQDETASAVKVLLSDKENLKYEITGLKRQIIDLKLQLLQNTDGNICIIDQGLTNDDMRYFANNMVDRCRVFGVFCEKENGFKYICASSNTDMRQFGKELNAGLNGKGGGSDKMIQGSVLCDKEDIEKFFNTKY